MRRNVLLFFLVLIFAITCLVVPVYAAIETSSYDWTLGKYDIKTKTFSPLKTSEFYWNNMWVRTIGPWSVYNGADGTRQGSIIAFVDRNRPDQNGYPMVCEDDWDKWISYFNGSPKYVKSALSKWKLLTGNNITWKTFANFSELVELCGGKGVSYNIGSASSIYARSYNPVASLTASSYAVKPGQAFKLFITAKSYTYYYQYIDVKLTGAGNTYINQRFNSTNVNVEKNLIFSAAGQYRFTLQINDGVYRYVTKEIVINCADDPVAPEQPPSEPPPDPPKSDPNEPPVAKFTWPSTAYEDDEVKVTENSVDYDGQVVDWTWSPSPSTGVTKDLKKGGGTISFPTEGTYNLSLRVEDDDGASDRLTRSITILKPVPKAVINYSGTLKENRKMILDSSDSLSAGKYPIDHSKDEWTIEPVSGGTNSDIKYGQKNGSTQEVLFKKAGTYKVGLRVANSKYQSEWVYKEIVIVPDDPPVANFIVPTIVFREPLDLSYATIKLTDKSYSADYDLISQRIWKYKFDSNNNGDFSDDFWVELDSNNNAGPYLRVNHVGKYLFELEVKESFGQPTIPELITDADYRRGDTLAKASSQKIVNVQNVAPVTSFSAQYKNKADILFVLGDISSEKTSDLRTKIDNYVLPKMFSSNVDTKTSIVNTVNLGANILQQPSFEVTNLSSSSRPWGHYAAAFDAYDSTRVKLNTDTAYVRSGQKSVKIESDGSRNANGFCQKVTGWTAGQKVSISAYINVPRYVKGYIAIDLYAINQNGDILDSVIRKNYSGITTGWQQIELLGDIPAETKDLYFRIFTDGTPDSTWYVDDVSVNPVTYSDLFSVDPGWRTDTQKYMVYLSEKSFDKTNSNSLGAEGINFSVLGTDQNKALAEAIFTSNANQGIFQYNTNIDTALSNLGTYISNDSSKPKVDIVFSQGYLDNYNARFPAMTNSLQNIVGTKLSANGINYSFYNTDTKGNKSIYRESRLNYGDQINPLLYPNEGYFQLERVFDLGETISRDSINSYSIRFMGWKGTYALAVSPDNKIWYDVGSWAASPASGIHVDVIKEIPKQNIPIANFRYTKMYLKVGGALDGYYQTVNTAFSPNANLADIQDKANTPLRGGAIKYVVSLAEASYVDANSTTITNTANSLNQNNAHLVAFVTSSSSSSVQQLTSKVEKLKVITTSTDLSPALNQLADYIVSQKAANAQMTSFIPILQNESLGYNPIYSDYENDSKYAENWYISHDPNYVDNNSGISTYNGKTLSSPPATFDKVGKYDLQYKAQDNPADGDTRFSNYFLWSTPAPTLIVVHRKPIAQFSVQAGTLYITDLSYDPDFQYKRPDKGVVERFWQWKKTTDTNWTVGKPTGITQPGNYYFYLQVKDNYGVWSDPYQMAVTVTDPNRPPDANFNWTPTAIYEADDVILHNLSSDADGDPLTYQWTVFNPQGVTTTYSTKDVFLSNVLPGTYWVTLRVWDNKGATDVITKSFTVNPLSIEGQVKHSEEWNAKRIAYNRSVSGTDNDPRPYKMFWAGEKFILIANTTDTGPSTTKASSVTVNMPYIGSTVTLTGNANNTKWSGEMWQSNFVNLPDGPYQFNFHVTYSNGAVKTYQALIDIEGSIYDYYNYHRSE